MIKFGVNVLAIIGAIYIGTGIGLMFDAKLIGTLGGAFIGAVLVSWSRE